MAGIQSNIIAFLRQAKWLVGFASGCKMPRSLMLWTRCAPDLRIAIYPKVFVRMGKCSACKGSGRLRFGARWPNCGYFESELVLGDDSVLTVDGDMSIYTGARVTLAPSATLRFGNGYISNNAIINCFDSIWIGDDVAISKNVTIRDSDNHEMVGGQAMQSPIQIGDHVWIGMNAIVLKGVTIGDGSVVAAGAVVTREVPPNSLVAGIPARVVRQGVVWK